MTCPSDRRDQRGFTLLEMLVVLLLLGLATALVAPRLSLGGAALDADAHTLAAALLHARDQAVRTGRPVEVRLDMPLPGTAALRVVGDAELMGDGVARLRFLSDGSASGADIRLTGQHGGERRVAVDWLTGRVRHDAN